MPYFTEKENIVIHTPVEVSRGKHQMLKAGKKSRKFPSCLICKQTTTRTTTKVCKKCAVRVRKLRGGIHKSCRMDDLIKIYIRNKRGIKMSVLGYDDIYNYIETYELKLLDITENTIRENGIDCRIGDTLAIDIDLSHEEDDTGFTITHTIDSHSQKSIESRFIIKQIDNPDSSIIIPARTNIILATKEQFQVPNDLMGFCCLRSSFARNGFSAPVTVVDAGFQGTLSIGMFYGGNNPIKIYKGDRFLQVVFLKINTPVSKPYKGVYNGQTEVRLPKPLD